MTDQTVLNFSLEGALGRVFRVDTGSVWAEALDHELLTRVAVGSLIAIQGANASEFLIGLLDRVTRDVFEDVDGEPEEGTDYDVPEVRQRDLLRVVLVGTYRTVEGDRVNTFKRGADSYPLIDASCWSISGSNLQRLMGLLSQKVDPERRLNLGTFVADASAEAVADGDRLFQRHAALLGSTGSGKSWAVALILEKAKRLAHPNLIVFDMHGEYGPLTEGPSPIAKGFKVANPNIAERSATEVLNLPWWLLNQEEMQALLLDRSETNAPNQAARLSHHVRNLKLKELERGDRVEMVSRFTVDSPIPYSLSDLLAALQSDDEERVPGSRANTDKAGPFFGTLSRFIARLRSRTEDRRYSFMFDPDPETHEYEWLHEFADMLLSTEPGIKVVDFSEVPSDVLPVVVGVLARLLYEVHFWTDPEKRTPVTFVCDEAHLYVPESGDGVVSQRAVEAFERIAKEGRKYGISLMIVSQRPSDVSRTVLSQCNNFVVLRLTNDQDQALVRRLMPDSLGGITAALPLLDVGEAIVLGDAMVLPTRVRLHRPDIEPRSATMDFWTDWGTKKVDSKDLTSAVEAMRRQSRGLPNAAENDATRSAELSTVSNSAQ